MDTRNSRRQSTKKVARKMLSDLMKLALNVCREAYGEDVTHLTINVSENRVYTYEFASISDGKGEIHDIIDEMKWR